MARSRRRLGFALAGLVAAALVALWLALPSLAGAVLRHRLAALGIPAPQLRVVELGLGHARIEGLALGSGGELRASAVVAAYSLAERRVERLAIDGLAISARLDGGRVSLGSLDAAIDALMASDAGGAQPTISLSGARLALITPLGAVEMPFEGEIGPRPGGLAGTLEVSDGRIAFGAAASGFAGSLQFATVPHGWPRLTARFDLAGADLAGARFAAGRLALEVAASRATAQLELAEPNMSFRLDVSIDGLDAAPRLTASAAVDAAAAAALWPWLGLPRPTDGRLRVSAAAAGGMEGAAQLRRPTLADMAAVELAGAVSFDAEALVWPGLASGIAASGGFDYEIAEGRLAVAARSDIVLEGTPDSTVLEYLPATIAGQLAGAWSLSLAAPLSLSAGLDRDFAGDLPFSLATAGGVRLDGRAALAGKPERFEGTLGAELALSRIAGIGADDVSLGLDLALIFADGKLAAKLARPGRVLIGTLRAPGLEPVKGLRLPLRAGWIEVGASSLAHEIEVGPVASTPLRPTFGGTPVDISLASLRLAGEWTPASGYRASLRLDGGLEGPRASLRELNVAGALARPPGGPASFDLGFAGRLVSADKPAWFVPVALDGKVKFRRDLEFSARLADPAGHLSLTVAGRHRPRDAAGRATVELAPLQFSRDVRPRDLVPALGSIVEEANGKVALAGTVDWSRGGLGADLHLLLQELSLSTPFAEIERINAVIDVDGLGPLTTPPGQQIAVGLIGAGLPLSNGLLTFQLLPGRIEIAGGRLAIAGGEINVEPGTLDTTVGRNELALQASAIDLGQLVALAQVDGLAATGTLGGRIPVTIEGGDWLVRGGRLSAEGPGLLAYAPANPPAALAGQGESVQLALSAMRNFLYKELDLTIDRQPGGDMAIGVHILGSNPDLYDGYPVALNFNVSGRLDQILRQSLVGYRVPDAIRRKLATFGAE